MSVQKIIAQARKEIPHITAEQLYRMLNNKSEKVVVLDTREKEEVKEGKIAGAIYIPRSYLELEVENVISDKNTKIVVYCASGARALVVAKSLKELGFCNVYNLHGGFRMWLAYNFPVEKEESASPGENLQEDYFYQRYARQFKLPEIGESGQKKLQNSKVLVIGAGGLGCPCLLYLAASGVGTIGIVDSDLVEEENLHRQILHFTSFINRPKTESAYFTLKNINPYINIQTHQLRLNKENILDIFKNYDIIVDGSDNFTTKYLVNDACIFLGKPYVHASIYKFEAQLSSFYPRKTACYRCIFPEPPSLDLAPRCEDTGVLGVIPGVLGLLQATEVIKIILNIGEVLYNKILYFNALTNTFKIYDIEKNSNCPICGESAVIKELIEYTQFCTQS